LAYLLLVISWSPDSTPSNIGHEGRLATEWDYLVTSIALLLCLPIFITTALLIYLENPGPIFDDGRLSLLEIGQVPAEHHQDFQDIETFQYFNTNNLWVDLQAVKEMIHHDQLRLPIILNHKRCAETDIIQIETAMGAGLECFNLPGLIEVSRDRFAPVKKLSDLFLLQSDVYSLNERFQLTLNTERPKQYSRLPRITFHSGFPVGNQLEGGFADPARISMLHAESLTVGGMVFFAGEQQIRGVVRVENGSQQLLTVTSENIGCFQQETAT